MILNGFGDENGILHSEIERSKELKECFKALDRAKIVEKSKEKGRYEVINEKILKYLWRIPGLNPIFCSNFM